MALEPFLRFIRLRESRLDEAPEARGVIQLAQVSDLVSCETDESAVEIRIKADRTVIETRLSSWGAALEEALA